MQNLDSRLNRFGLGFEIFTTQFFDSNPCDLYSQNLIPINKQPQMAN
ncbi:hypothetical protein HFN_1727 [Helicobacter fennelliae MRY12-0050]|uniref:Uncharacterized protein n=1 Tax=Helicobacter fennelliae MRY12-0050 TaxID=1325130 RepID=T1CMY7_9HELI|nr:hypothetical protein HFN_1727 [Helicobacter fennelliae MRY12-0050]